MLGAKNQRMRGNKIDGTSQSAASNNLVITSQNSVIRYDVMTYNSGTVTQCIFKLCGAETAKYHFGTRPSSYHHNHGVLV